MKNFSDWLENRLFRVDPERRDFEKHSNLRQYFITNKGESGPVSSPNVIPDWGKSLEGMFKTGLYAGRYHEVISYLIPRELPWIIVPTKPKKTLYIRKQDIKNIQEYSPWISSFNQNDFETLDRDGQGEYFTEKPPKALKQIQIKNPWRILQNNFIVIPVDDIMDTHKELKNKKIGFDSEGSFFV